MNKTYFQANETNDLQLLYELNEHEHWFDSIQPTKEKSQIDAIAKHKNRRFGIELKRRYVQLKTYKTIMIEPYKYLELIFEYIFNGLEPLYINFLHDAVVIFNLNKIKHKPNFTIHNIKSQGYEVMQCSERRYHLDLRDAVIYKKENNEYKLIQQ